MYEEKDYLQLSGIQHFAFCRRQWALIHVEEQWMDNYLTASGSIEHDRVHNDAIKDIRNGRITIRGLKVFSKRLGVSGVCDAVEFIPASDGITLYGKEGKWKVLPIEYKHGTKKSDDCDKLQVALQAICLEEMFFCDISEGCLYYHENRRRENFEITVELIQKARAMLEEMHLYMKKGYTPIVKPGKFCNNCSLKDICMPTLMKNRETVKSYIDRYLGGAENEKNA